MSAGERQIGAALDPTGRRYAFRPAPILGNGSLLVTLSARGEVEKLFWPNVDHGQHLGELRLQRALEYALPRRTPLGLLPEQVTRGEEPAWVARSAGATRCSFSPPARSWPSSATARLTGPEPDAETRGRFATRPLSE